MKKIISISLDETTLKYIDKARGLVTRSKFIESMIKIEEWIKTIEDEEKKYKEEECEEIPFDYFETN